MVAGDQQVQVATSHKEPSCPAFLLARETPQLADCPSIDQVLWLQLVGLEEVAAPVELAAAAAAAPELEVHQQLPSPTHHLGRGSEAMGATPQYNDRALGQPTPLCGLTGAHPLVYGGPGAGATLLHYYGRR